jgi:hypothetical protein
VSGEQHKWQENVRGCNNPSATHIECAKATVNADHATCQQAGYEDMSTGSDQLLLQVSSLDILAVLQD